MADPCEKAKQINDLDKCVAVLKSRWKTVGAVLTILIALSGTGTTLVYRSSIHAKDLQTKSTEKIEKKCEKNIEKIQALEVVAGKMQSDLEHVKKAVDKQDAKLDAILEAVNNE